MVVTIELTRIMRISASLGLDIAAESFSVMIMMSWRRLRAWSTVSGEQTSKHAIVYSLLLNSCLLI